MDEFTNIPSFVQARHLPSDTQKDTMPLLTAYMDLRYQPCATLRVFLAPVPQTTWLIVFDAGLIGRPNVLIFFLLKAESFKDACDFANWVMTDRKTGDLQSSNPITTLYFAGKSSTTLIE